MDNLLIHADNAFDTALFLLNFDKSSIKDHMQLDAGLFIKDLKVALAQFQQPLRHKQPYPTITLLDQNLKHLISAIRNFYAILTDESKQQLINLLQPPFSAYPASLSANAYPNNHLRDNLHD